MDGLAKKIIVALIAVVVVISAGAAVFSLIHQNNRNAAPQPSINKEIYTGMQVNNPLKTVDSNGDDKMDAVESLNVNINQGALESMVDENHDGIPDSLEISEQNYVGLPSSDENGSFGSSGNSYIPEENAKKYLRPGEIEDMKVLGMAFPGYGMQLREILESQKGGIDIAKNVRRGAYGIPVPDMQWLQSQGNLKKYILPFMHFGPHGFNWTEFNVTKFKHVVRIDNNSDGNPEYYREVSYLNLTQDKNHNGIYEVEIIRYHMMMYYDNNSDGIRNYEKWIDALYYSVDSNEDNISEEKAVVGIVGCFYDNNSDGNPEFFHVRAVGNETVDSNEDGVYETHIVMLGNVVKYDNNSNGNWEYVRAYFASKGVVDQNEDGNPEVLAVSVTGYTMKNKNDDSHPDYIKYIHWRYVKKDPNSDGKVDAMNAMEAEGVYFDNSSNGYPEYVHGKILALAYNKNNASVNNSLVKGIATWEIENPDDDEHNNTLIFKIALLEESSPIGNNTYRNLRKMFGEYVMYDNNSDGNPEYKNFLMLGGMYLNATNSNGTNAQHRGVIYVHLLYRDKNSDGNPECVISKTFYREQWGLTSLGFYSRDRGLAEYGYKYDNNSNGVFEKKSLEAFGYMAFRNATNGNITDITVVAIKGNATNIDDTGIAEFQNYTFVVVHKIDKNGNGNPEYVKVIGVKHWQFLNETGLINITIMAKYWYVDANDNGLRDRYVLQGVKIIRIDYNLDGEWDKVTTKIIYKSGSDE